ncbi:MAG: ribbon-helix-helix domain-containing protein [Proteobacteria bacterium]|nr:ribbon-helix-helix domain-containing protein [Pseudomonadota bacterium]
MAVSLRIPPEVKKKVERLAEAQDTTAHAYMLKAIREKVEAEEARAAFHAEARKRLARMKQTGMGIPAEEVRAYLHELAAGGNPPPPKPRKIA